MRLSALTCTFDIAHTQKAIAALDPYLLRDRELRALDVASARHSSLTLHPRVRSVIDLPASVRDACFELNGEWGSRQLVLGAAQHRRLFTVLFYSKSKLCVPLQPGLPRTWRRVLSNFWPAELTVDGATYASAEHCFQARKAACSDRPEMACWFRVNYEGNERVGTDPLAAKQAGARRGFANVGAVLDVDEWERQRLSVARTIVEARWTQQSLFRGVLESTDKLTLLHYERGGAHSFWGGNLRKSDATLQGQNTLGELLMSLRDGTLR